tara:strand:- start:2373 stop:3746 length:1374 start_codon:yes stop_codon:yes gene_type:complete
LDKIFSLLNYFGTSVVNSLVNLFIIYVVSQELGNEIFNSYIILIFICEFISTLIIFGLDDGIIRFYRDKGQVEVVKSNILIFCYFTTFILFIIWYFIDLNHFSFISFDISNDLKNLIFLYGSSLAFVRIISINYISLFKSSTFRNLNILRSLLILLFLILFFNNNSSLTNVFSFLVISNFVVILLSYKLLIIDFSKFDISKILNFLSFSSPLIVYALFSLTSDYSTRILLKYVDFDPSNLASFNFYLSIALLVQGLNRVFNKFWNPYSQNLLSQNKNYNSVCANLSILFSVLFWSIVFFISLFDNTTILEYFIKIEFVNNFYYLLLLIPPIYFNFLLMIYISKYYYLKQTIKITSLNLICNIFSILIGVFLSLNYGTLGAIVAFNFSPIFSILLLCIFFYSDKIHKNLIKSFSFNMLLLSSNFVIVYYFQSSYVFLIFIIVMFYFFINRKSIKSLAL